MAHLDSIYADYNATTPLCEPVLDALASWKNRPGNLSSPHQYGQAIHGIYDQAVDRIREVLGAQSYDLLTTSSATEANNWWIYSILDGVSNCPRVITTPIEHPCVLVPLQRYADQGQIDLQFCRMKKNGVIDTDHLATLMTEDTLMVSVMMANNEIGSIQPLDIVVQLARSVGALVHSDIVQAAGKLTFNLNELGIDAVTLSAHKCYAPTGCGVLLVKDSHYLKPLFYGGSQQQKLRAGTVNVMGLDLFAAGLEYCYNQLSHHLDIHAWGRSLCDAIPALKPVVPIKSETLLWNTLPLAIVDYLSHDAMMKLDIHGLAVATGSACSSGAVDISPVLRELSLPESLTKSVVRFSFGYPTTLDELNHTHRLLSDIF